jgi:redox-sensitive bicupin YhaK (pirin superfamily)
MLRARTVANRSPLREHQPGPGVRVSGVRLDPWLGVEHFRIVDERRGARPHVGVAVLTYLFEDSLGAMISRVEGNEDRWIGPGAAYCLQSGRGAVHQLAPVHAGVECHGLRVSIALMNDRDAPCAYVDAGEIPEVETRGARVRVIAGCALGVRSPLAVHAPVTVLDVHLAPGAELGHVAPAGHHAWAISIRGEGKAGPEKREVGLIPSAAVAFAADGDAVRLRAGETGLHVVVAHAPPLRPS